MKNTPLKSTPFDTSQLFTDLLKLIQLPNKPWKLVTLETFHLSKGWLNNSHELNVLYRENTNVISKLLTLLTK